jgi:hypothetical protein
MGTVHASLGMSLDGRVVKEIDLELGDDRTLRVYDTAADDADGRLAVF